MAVLYCCAVLLYCTVLNAHFQKVGHLNTTATRSAYARASHMSTVQVHNLSCYLLPARLSHTMAGV
jgi:hypothetical protein